MHVQLATSMQELRECEVAVSGDAHQAKVAQVAAIVAGICKCGPGEIARIFFAKKRGTQLDSWPGLV